MGRCGSLWDRCGSLWIVVDRCGIVVDRCGSLWVVVDRCGSLWVVPGFSNYLLLRTLRNVRNVKVPFFRSCTQCAVFSCAINAAQLV